MEQMGRAGFTVSVACGPCGPLPFAWSVQVLAPDGREFDRPYRAYDFAQAIQIAIDEIHRRGWAVIEP